MRRLLAPLAISLLSAFPALADEGDLARSDRVLAAISMEDLEAVIEADGFTIRGKGSEENVWVLAQDGDTPEFAIIGTACGRDGAPSCLGLQMLVEYTGRTPASPALLNEANQLWAAAKTTAEDVNGAEVVYVSRYLILDGGVTVENILENLDNFLAIAPQVEEFLWP